MPPQFSFEITSKDKSSRARAGIIKTLHGIIETPYLIPVATRAEIITLSQDDVQALNLQALLANTYHLHFMPPGDEEIKRKGGLHQFMNFPKPIFTDSAGFQALSLGFGKTSKMRKIGFFPKENVITADNNEKSFVEFTKEGIIFASSYNESEKRFIGPKESMQIQSNLGADVIMAFDQCNPPGQSEEETKESMNISHQWELESLKYRNPNQALYGIIHGGVYPNLRKRSCKFVSELPFDGIAIGGSIGKDKEEMYFLLDIIIENLKSVEQKPMHMLGIGWVDDVFECIERGIDTFDCVQTTRVARHGHLYISPKSGGSKENKFKITIRQSKYSQDKSPIDSRCSCPTCKSYSRQDLHKMKKSKSPQYARLATIHNLHFMEKLLKEIRTAIKENCFQELKKFWLKN